MAQTVRKGDCECCPNSIDVELFAGGHGMLMCLACFTKENEAIATIKASNAVIQESRRIDSEIQVKSDLFNAGTVSFVTLKAAIDNNPEVADDRKSYALAEVVRERITKLQSAISDKRAALQADENEKQALLVNMQNLVATLRVEEREKFKSFNVNYSPNVTGTPKPRVVGPTTRKNRVTGSDMNALRDAAKKYNVPADAIRLVMVNNKKLTLDQAAQMLAGKF